jgi:hypothetical protein
MYVDFTIVSVPKYYFASDSMSWYISYLRAKEKNMPEKAAVEKKGLHRMLHLSTVFLILTEFAFGIAVLLFAVGIYRLM